MTVTLCNSTFTYDVKQSVLAPLALQAVLLQFLPLLQLVGIADMLAEMQLRRVVSFRS